MSDKRYIAAIEISSSKIIAAVGVTNGCALDVIAIEEDKGVESVRYGIIQNLEETSLRIARIIDKLQHRPGVMPRQITGLFVGIGGRSVRSIPSEISLNLPDDTEITEDILERLRADALRAPIESSLEIIDAVPRIYRVGNLETHSPKGTVGNHIQATFDLIVCRPELIRNIYRTIQDKLGIRVEGIIVTGLATGHLMLSDEERRLGCMLVDMGAETTTVTIYSKGCLRYFVTLPLGGRNITRDIQTLNLLEKDAEEIKKTSGSAIAPETPSTLNLNGVKLSDVSNLLVARAEEIVANVVEQIEYAGLKEGELPAKIRCIGGGARLQNIGVLLSNQSNLPVDRAKYQEGVVISDTRNLSLDHEEVVSVLYAGASLSDCECLEEPKREELPVNDPETEEPEEEIPVVEKPKKPKSEHKWMEGFKRRLSGIFSNPDEDDDSDLLD